MPGQGNLLKLAHIKVHRCIAVAVLAFSVGLPLVASGADPDPGKAEAEITGKQQCNRVRKRGAEGQKIRAERRAALIKQLAADGNCDDKFMPKKVNIPDAARPDADPDAPAVAKPKQEESLPACAAAADRILKAGDEVENPWEEGLRKEKAGKVLREVEIKDRELADSRACKTSPKQRRGLNMDIDLSTYLKRDPNADTTCYCNSTTSSALEQLRRDNGGVPPTKKQLEEKLKDAKGFADIKEEPAAAVPAEKRRDPGIKPVSSEPVIAEPVVAKPVGDPIVSEPKGTVAVAPALGDTPVNAADQRRLETAAFSEYKSAQEEQGRVVESMPSSRADWRSLPREERVRLQTEWNAKFAAAADKADASLRRYSALKGWSCNATSCVKR